MSGKLILVKTQLACLVVSLVVLSFPVESLSLPDMMEPKYASSETKEVIQELLKAHGGMEKWCNAPSVNYDFVMYLPIMEQMTGGKMKGWQLWRAAHTTIEPRTLRAYTDLPWEGASIASDGKRIWTVGYPRG